MRLVVPPRWTLRQGTLSLHWLHRFFQLTPYIGEGAKLGRLRYQAHSWKAALVACPLMLASCRLSEIMDSEDVWLSLKPSEPLPSQCCGSGCKPCIYDIYQKELEKWEEAKAKKDRSLLNRKKQQCYETGRMSQYVKTWKEGDKVFWRGPFGGFPYTANQYGELFMLASGTGLAPMLPIIQYITGNEDDETFVTLVGCFKTFENIYMKSLLQEQARFWNIRTFYVLSQERSLENLPWSFQGNTHIGRINENMIRSMMDTCRKQPFVLICGSVTFSEDMERHLKAIGLGEESYFVF
ncbi:NADH-cytochrome b5 reductase-like isoform X3 [Varanus komodoensis]|uniref:NADH-cytochrome b5 reductase-like isoform X3 n=1 Tax=Varanus komodoensis TaxID=61221 RepID=UPI001CF78338|nr:NADH-cytochrome b5 reductase-like isoform X3 [Varanus komodoensis]